MWLRTFLDGMQFRLTELTAGLLISFRDGCALATWACATKNRDIIETPFACKQDFK
ncbi:MAG: hypothetical protein JAZ17_12100 [Candidatus Thiodiazotropha endolucinida]|nr:hypothetical protein [Candidatus Thiodiazotropha endolucinida]